MMSEHEAWKWLADLWRTAGPDPDSERGFWIVGFPYLGGKVVPFHGICSCITALQLDGRITGEVEDRMDEALDKERERLKEEAAWYVGIYYWPKTAFGAAERVAFCKRMVEATKPC